jgi:hypothetical protein
MGCSAALCIGQLAVAFRSPWHKLAQPIEAEDFDAVASAKFAVDGDR